MRVKDYIAVLLLVAIGGAAVLSIAIGSVINQEKHALENSGHASQTFQSVENLAGNSDELLTVMDLLNSESTGLMLIVDRFIKRCRNNVSELQGFTQTFDTQLLAELSGSFDELVDQGRRAALSGGSADAHEEKLAQYDAIARTYRHLLEQLQVQAESTAISQLSELNNQRQRNRVIIVLIALIYLGAIALLHQWTTRRVVRPLRNLASAAHAAMNGDAEFSMAADGPTEVRSLITSVRTFVESLESTIEQRTAALRETHMALQNAMPGISRLDVEGRYERLNVAYAALLGYSEGELAGAHWERTTHPDDLARGRDAYQQMVRDGTAEFEARALRKDGTSFYKQVLMVKITAPAGNMIGHHCFMRDVTERKHAESEKESTQQKLVELSRRAGMAEVATNVLHNVGNVLNSVNVSATLVADKLRHLQLSDLVAVTELMRERAGDLGTFITSDAKGKLLPHFLRELGSHLVHEQGAVLQELESLTTNIGHIKDIVNTQQSYARISGVVEEVRLAEMVETALRFNSAAMERHKVRVVREFDQDPCVLVDKHKVLQILVNLISNAKYAVESVAPEDRRLTVRIGTSPDRADFVQIAVIDNGVGIPRENLIRIFAHGFTTKKDGHGFGLHGSALAAKEMGGALTAQSEGPSRGAIFTLELPLKPVEMLT